ncbi:MAG TPA: ATP-dependent zinc metalloprotease FtsH [Herpetosiphonaceae bacterium]|nr:ATP-dependent zinc metalloprotease FtsH [Herpetosiphonaceae bacterium]
MEWRRTIRFSLIYFAISLVALFAFEWFLLGGGPREAPYSQFIQALEQRQVARAQIGDRTVLWIMHDQQQPFVSTRIPGVDDSALLAQLRSSGAEFAGRFETNWWGTVLSWLLPILLIFGLWGMALPRLPGQAQALSLGRSRGKIYDKGDVKVTFADVAGLDEAVAEMREVVDFLRDPQKYQRLGGRIPKGVLLAGPPGTGKTLLARATAGEAQVPFFSLSGSEFVEMFVGVGAARVRDLFDQAKRKAPCIVFIDEIDTIGRQRGGAAAMTTHEEREQTLNQLLVEMDGFDSQKGVIIMAATNRPDVLDPALLRPGRFDRQIVVDRPDLRGREAVLRVHARDVRLAPDADLKVIAARTVGFAGAELANVVNEAALLAARRGKDNVGMREFEDAIDHVMAGLERKSRVLTDAERDRVAYHELGHALVATLLPHADPVHKVSIVARGVAALGVTLQLPLQDRYLYSESELHDRLAVMLGGRAAEVAVYGEVSTGAQNDLQQATALARRMVAEFGMSTLGPVAFDRDGGADNAGSLPIAERPWSERSAEAIDAEIKALIERNYARALDLLKANRGLMDELAEELKAREEISGRELRERVAGRVPQPAAEVIGAAVAVGT